MSNLSGQPQSFSNAIADIYLPDTSETGAPRSIGEVLRPLLLEIRRSRMTGDAMRKDIVDRFCTPPADQR